MDENSILIMLLIGSISILLVIVIQRIHKKREEQIEQYIVNVTKLKEEVDSKLGAIIESKDVARILRSALYYKELAFKKNYNFDEAVFVVSYANELQTILYRNNFVIQTNSLKKEINDRCGFFIELSEEQEFITRAKSYEKVVDELMISFAEKQEFHLYIEKMSEWFYANNVEYLNKYISEYLRQFYAMIGNGEEYIIKKNISVYAKQFREDSQECFERCARYKSEMITKFLEIYTDPEKYLIDMNTAYMENEKLVCASLFDNIEGKSLDINQRNAVVNDDFRQLIIAGAGSGKTLTVSAKVKYLVDRKNINPKDILLISFTRKAAEEMQNRISKLGIDIDSATFHKYGLDIIRKVCKKTPDIAEEMGEYVEQYLKYVVMCDQKRAKNFLLLLGALMMPVFEQDVKIGERIETEQRCDLTTIKGMYESHSNKMKAEKLAQKISALEAKMAPLQEKLNQIRAESISADEKEAVEHEIGLIQFKIYELMGQKRSIRNEQLKSAEEVILANMFFLDGVEYEYEAVYPYDDMENFRKKYRPDFHLKESDVYWEHFGINEQNRAKQYDSVVEREYLEGIEWKRRLHEQNNTKLAETYSWQFRNNKIGDAIQDNYKKYGIKRHEISYSDVLKEVLKGDTKGNFESIKTLLTTFIALFKSCGYKIEKFQELRETIKDYDFEGMSSFAIDRRKERDTMFIEFAEGFYEFYNEQLRKEEKIDFNDMILQAEEYVTQGNFVPNYKYVIIDEYQDISVGRYKLIKATLERSNAKLFCVGDDWQSIYRFSGSEVDLLINFDKYFGEYSRTDITQTYRNSQELLDISGAFIQKNKYQTTKTLSSGKHCVNPLRLAPYTGNNSPITEGGSPELEIKFTTAFRTAVTEIVREFPTGSILLLGRNNSDIKFLSEDNRIQVIEKPGETRVVMKDYPEVEMTFMTVHRSKGLEADNVILLNAKNEKAGFPNQIVDDPILNLLREAHEEYPFAEERRLFYVAITRTRNYVYILTPIVKTSRFIDDLKELKSGINEIRTEVAQEIEKNKYSNTISCPVCKVGTLVKRKGAENKTFVSCSNFPACNYKTSDLQTVRNNTRCPVCDNFLIKRKGAFGEFLGCLSYPHCTYSADLQSEKDMQTRITSYASRFDYSPPKWTLEEDYQLKEKFHNGTTIEMLSVYFGRSRSAIISRLKKLELID